MVYAVVRRWTANPTAALFAAMLAAVDRNFIFYSQEARVYVFIQLVGFLNVALFVEILRGSKPWARAFWSSFLASLRRYTASRTSVRR